MYTIRARLRIEIESWRLMSESLTPTFFLFARPSFFGGIAALLDFGNTLFEYNMSLTTEQANYFAMRSNWLAVGEDIRESLRRAVFEMEGAGVGGQEAT